MNKYHLKWLKPTLLLRHGGPRPHRRVRLLINGKEWAQWREDSQQTNYSVGRYFDQWVHEEVARLRKFFPGKLKVTGKKYR